MEPMHLTGNNFEQEVLKAEGTVLVDFWASWCGPCQMLMPVIQEIAAEANGFKVGKVNVDEEPELAAAYKIMSIPTLIVFKNGKEYKKSLGAIPKKQILDMLQ